MVVLQLAVGAVLAAWFLLTVAANTPKLGGFVFRRLSLGRWCVLIPSWNFFAPRPGTTDNALFYRDRYDSGELSPWHELLESSRPKGLLAPLWNPEGRPKKALSDAVNHLIQHASAADGEDDAVVLSVPYLLLLTRVSRVPRALGVTGRQFLVVRHSMVDANPQVVMLSKVHEV